MPTIANAPSGENTSPAGTEKIPVSGSQFILLSTIAEYIRTLTQTLTNKTLTSPTINNPTINTITSGTYTPTRSAESNLDSNVTMSEAQYVRVMNTVTVSGRFTADPTAASAASFEITLPVASNIGTAEDVAGVAFCGSIAGQGAEIIGVAANDTAKVQWLAVDVTSQSWSYVFSYQII